MIAMGWNNLWGKILNFTNKGVHKIKSLMLNWDYLVFSGLTVPDVPPTSFSSIQPMLTVALHHFLLNVQKIGEQESWKKLKLIEWKMKKYLMKTQ